MNNSESANFIGVPEASEYTNIPPETLKRYLINHEQFLNFKKEGRRYKISIESLDLLKKIRELYSEGLLKEDVNDNLASDGLPITITVKNQDEKGSISINDELSEIRKMLQQQEQQMTQQMQFNQKLVEELQKVSQTNQELKQMINRKDAELIGELRKGLSESKRMIEEASASAELEKKKTWWEKLMGK
jgi:hypothetical protein